MEETPLHKVWWSDEEERRLALCVARMRLNYPEPHLVTLIKRAMEQFPLERRRMITSVSHCPGVITLVRQELTRVRDLAREVEVPPPPPPSPEAVLDATPTDKLLCYTLGRVLTDWDTERRELAKLAGLQRAVDDLLRRAPPPTPTPPRPGPRPQQLRVAVFGLLAGQMVYLQAACPGVDFTFVSKDVKHPTVPPGVDYVFLFTRFIAHATEAAVISAVGKQRVVRHAGGLSQAIKAINALSAR